ncbi:MAG: alpha/beta hydrolase family protein [Methylophilus sp.]|uniref:alpha/beta hydrolase family protein n=1 Tax=Methylophilus sp. TaxID=29541 RepID=UPI003FA0183F
MRVSTPCLITTLILASLPAKAADPVTVTTPRGAPITVVANFPEGPGPFTTVILGPGTGTMKQKINEVVERELLKNNIAVYRFEWAFYVKDKNSKPSDTDRSPELEDFSTVIALAKADKHVDPKSIIVGGKSRGTVIAWQMLRNDPTLKGILQLTPVCSKQGFTADQLYPDLASESRPSLWIAGDADSACNINTLYGFLAHAGGPARAAIVIGDHGLAGDVTSQLTAAFSADFVSALGRDRH